ncbi:hypothetical protein [Arenimonas composti]|uniref:UDP-N-acetyl-alpha-D-muramoyl-L-alanyl-L-glutamate epimerase n=1 Tax=Arenimonas composti TR7-09 = DSM 18010 TaxID=1121013 RepID=A0A091BHM0_9GAMM|nr:hypothetical protein [Arenimonas composti]KFN50997.1 hypothetical protein P873_04690 [Arenimonas composti TR7-09 = DSM 18010]
MSDFDRAAVRAFRFVDCAFAPESGEARLVYAFDHTDEFVESLRFPGAPFVLDGERAAAVARALRLLHLIAGVSYYKAAVPPEIVIEGEGIGADTAALLQSVYENGLGEFAYRNGLSLRGRIPFPSAPVGAPAGAMPSAPVGAPSGAMPSVGAPSGAMPSPGDPEEASRLKPLLQQQRQPQERALVAIGGGKDSLVSIEALRAAGVEQTVAWIGSSPLIAACAARTGLPTLNVQRTLSPRLFELNRAGALNGHIPVTAINSAILVLAALLTGHDQVVFSNERSASYGSRIVDADGHVTDEVNHQWSKGWDFERDFAAHVRRHVAADLRYYSLLRPYSELAVARQFAKQDRYDAHFSSCNRNFHILGERPTQRWCGECPKCRFVFLALAPFMPKPRLMAIFGRNLLDEPDQAGGFDALMEFRDHKPFECVGEGIEARAAMAALAASPAWSEDALVRRFRDEIAPLLEVADLSIAPLLQASDDHGIPDGLWGRLRANF